MMCYGKALANTAPIAVILIRLMTGTVFLSEGIQKFLFHRNRSRALCQYGDSNA
jgi:uncharacterized membrane protein YphA (DoxX/SURF4 family)